MPGLDYTPTIAIASEFDARAWASPTVVLARGSNVTMNAFAAGEGLYDDALEFLHGMGSQSGRSMSDDLAVVGNGAGTWSVGLDTDDRFWVENDTVDWALTAGLQNALFGWPTAGFILTTLTGPPYRYTGASDWLRGWVPISGSGLTMEDSALPGPFSIPSVASYGQSVIVMLREVGSDGDADDSHGSGTTLCLESLDNAAQGVDSIRWGINATGYVYTTRPTGVSAIPTWSSTTFRDRLGFTGSETETTVGGLELLVAANPLPGFIVPSRPVENLRRWYGETTNVVDRITDLHSNNLNTKNGWNLEFWVGGPADTLDQSRHFLDQCMQYMTKGSRITVYQEWGDTRRAIDSRSGNNYTTLQTPEFNGRRGRLRCRRSGDDPAEKVANWRNRVEQAFLVTMKLQDVSD